MCLEVLDHGHGLLKSFCHYAALSHSVVTGRTFFPPFILCRVILSGLVLLGIAKPNPAVAQVEQ